MVGTVGSTREAMTPLLILFAFLVVFTNGFRVAKWSPIVLRTRVSMLNDQTVTDSTRVASIPSKPSIDVLVEDVQLKDIPELIYLAGEQFRYQQDTIQNYFSLQWSIISLFIPKVLFPDQMGHKLIGLKMKSDKKLIGFVDLSLQPCDGSLKVFNHSHMITNAYTHYYL